jgi:glycosyltransferase involved in cell wall biosynthesis
MGTVPPVTTGTQRTVVVVAGPLEFHGGLSQSTLETAQGLAERGWRIICVTTRRGSLTEAWERFATVHEIPQQGVSLRHPWRTLRSLQAARRLRGSGVDIVWANPRATVEWSHAVSRLLAARLVVHLRLDPPTLSRRFRRALTRADAVVAVSDTTRDLWQRHTGRADIRVIPNGIDLGVFTVDDSALPHSGADEPLHVVFLGRTDNDKGIDRALTGWSQAEPRLPAGSRLTVVGSSPSDGSARAFDALLARTPGTIEHRPAVRDVRPVLRSADVVLMPSRTETQGRVAIEAMALGVPVIGTAIGGLTEVLDGPTANRLLAAADPEEIADTVVEWAAARPVTGEQRTQLRRRAERYDLPTMVDAIDALFTDLRTG